MARLVKLRRQAVCILVLGATFASTAVSADEAHIEELASDIDHPWSLAFLPGGGYLVTSRSGELLRLAPDGSARQSIDGVPDVLVRSQAGLFDVLLAPDFERSGELFLSYAHGTADRNTLRVARARLVDSRLTGLEVIHEGTPLQSTPVHYGGRLAWHQDGTLLITTGDGFNYREQAQRLDNTFGKTLRVHADGSAPDDNPFAGNPDALPTIWTYGHRNAQGLAVLADGRVFQHEHGARGGDELNRLEAGNNYGWPVITLGVDYSGARISPYTEYPGMEQPLVDWTPSIAPSGLAWYDHPAGAEWRNSFFVGGLAEQRIRQVRMVDGEPVDQGPVLDGIQARIRDLRTGPDGALYVLTDSAEGRLLKVTPPAGS